MKILFIVPELPYPPINGIRIKEYEFIKRLSLKHDLYLLSFYDPSTDDIHKSLEEMKKFCKEIKLFSILPQKSLLIRGLREIFLPTPSYFDRYRNKLFEKELLNMVENYSLDIIHFDTVILIPYRFTYKKKIPTVASINDSLSLSYQDEISFLDNKRKEFFKKLLRMYQYVKIKRFERTAYPVFDMCHVVSHIDENYLRKLNPRINVVSVPLGIDTEFFKPFKGEQDYPSLIYVADFSGGAAEYALWFIDNVFSQLENRHSQIKLYLVGRNPKTKLLNIAKQKNNIIVTGYVDDIRPYLNKATIFISPSMKSCGMLNKVLQAMSMAKPIVGTPYSFYAIKEIEPGNHVMVATSPLEFIRSIDALLKSEDLRRTLGENARSLIEEKYSWSVIIARIEELYQNIIERRRIGR